MNHPPGQEPIAERIAGVVLAPGYRASHALSYLYAAFVTIGLFAINTFLQPYLLNVNLGLPPEVQGRTVSGLHFANELLALCLIAPLGALADKVGRRSVYACGFLWLGAGFLLYPTVRTVPQLLGCALFISVGIAAIGAMLGTVLADTPDERTRGRFVGLAGFCGGLGALVLVLELGKLPKRLADSGVDAFLAGRITFGAAAALCALSAVVVFAGLRRGSPSVSAPTLPLRRVLADGFAAARGNRRIWFAYLLQFGSFGDRVVLGTFLSLRLQQEWLDRGASMAEAADRARLPFVAAMAAGLVTSLLVGMLLDRFDRARLGIGAMLLAAVAYLLYGFLDDPTRGGLMVTAAALLGVGQIAATIAGQTLLGQEAPREVRGAVFGLAGVCGSIAILFALACGGWLYDVLSRGAPFFLLGGVNLVIFVLGALLLRKPAPAR